jgi:hypothetical protein
MKSLLILRLKFLGLYNGESGSLGDRSDREHPLLQNIEHDIVPVFLYLGLKNLDLFDRLFPRHDRLQWIQRSRTLSLLDLCLKFLKLSHR